MGACCSSEPTAPIESSRSITKRMDGDDDFTIKSHDRSCTDIIPLIVFIAFLIGLVGLVSVVAMKGDVYRVIKGYDNCGNVCGRKNPGKYNEISCFGKDMTQKKYLSDGECVSICPPDYQPFLSRCLRIMNIPLNQTLQKTGLEGFFQDVSEDLMLCGPDILILCGVAFVFSILMLILFRYAIGFVVWIILVGVLAAAIGGTIYLWILWNDEKKASNAHPNEREYSVGSYLVYAIIASVFTIILLLVFLIMRKRIQLVVQLFKEAGKAMAAMPLLILQPIITFIVLCAVVGFWILFVLWIESAGDLQATSNSTESFKYVKDNTILTARWYNLMFLYWMTQFVIGCQHMVIAGAIAAWFFTRDKNRISVPIITSFCNLVRYHLGTVALGSLLIAIVNFIRAILKFHELQLKGRSNMILKGLLRCCQCCLWCFDKFLTFLSRNAYIETAIFGYSFCRAGMQAFKLLASNILRVAAINSVGDVVLFLGKLLVMIATGLIGIELIQRKNGVHNPWVPIAIAVLCAYLIANCFMTVYEMTIDTIFLCFCEDCERNDGNEKPYYMSRGLMEFVKNSKKAKAALDKRE